MGVPGDRDARPAASRSVGSLGRGMYRRRELFRTTGGAAMGAVTLLGIPGGVSSADEPSIDFSEPLPRAGSLGVNEAFKAMSFGDASGAGWTRWTVQWFNVQPEPGELNLFYFRDDNGDSILERQLASGLKVAAMVLGTPEWAAETPDLKPGTSVPRGLYEPVFIDEEINEDNTWGYFMYLLASEFAGMMDVFEIWNEVEIPATGSNAVYNTWSGTAEEYYQLVKVASEAAKRANPDAKIMISPYSYFKDKDAGGGDRLKWFDEFASVVKAKGADPFDYFALNLYRNPHDLWDRYHGGVPLAAEKADRVGFRARLDAIGAVGKPIWLTEINAMPYDDPLPGWNPADRNDGFRITMAEQADYVLQAHALAFAAGYEKVFFQALQDDPYPVPDELWGLVRYSDDPEFDQDATRARPAYHAYRIVARFLADANRAELHVRKRNDPSGLSKFASRFEWAQHLAVFHKGSVRASVIWNGTGQEASISLKATGTSAILIDNTGSEMALEPGPDGRLTWVLPAAYRHFDLFGGDPPGYFYIGGRTFVIVEQGVSPSAPVDAQGFLRQDGQ